MEDMLVVFLRGVGNRKESFMLSSVLEIQF